MAWLTVEGETVTARRPKRFKVHWRGTGPAAGIPRFPHGTQVVVPRDKLFAGQPSLTPFFAFLSGVSQRVPPGTQAVATSSDQQFVDQRLLAPLLTFSWGLRMLAFGLILVALVPNLILGGLIWLDVINTPWSKHPAPDERSAPAIRLATLPVLTSPALLEATAGEQVSLPIALDGNDRVTAGGSVALLGLPSGTPVNTDGH